jgi:hypothetical protein
MFVTPAMKELLQQNTVRHYEWLYNREPWKSWERIVAREAEYRRQQDEQREAREEMRSLKKAQ